MIFKFLKVGAAQCLHQSLCTLFSGMFTPLVPSLTQTFISCFSKETSCSFYWEITLGTKNCLILWHRAEILLLICILHLSFTCQPSFLMLCSIQGKVTCRAFLNVMFLIRLLYCLGMQLAQESCGTGLGLVNTALNKLYMFVVYFTVFLWVGTWVCLGQGFFRGCSPAVCPSEVTSEGSLFPSELTVWLLEAWSLTAWDSDLTGCLNVLVTRQLATPEAVSQGTQGTSLGFLSPTFRSGIHHFATLHSSGVNHRAAHT